LRLLLDEMYSPQIASELRHRGHDVVAVSERAELVGRGDEELLALMAEEGRAIVTNNVDDFVPLVQAAAVAGIEHSGVLFTSDRSLPRSKAGIGRYVEVLGALLAAHPVDDALLTQVRWLP
jgi:predicted nuclease of predicted toxin-antitoxin system